MQKHPAGLCEALWWLIADMDVLNGMVGRQWSPDVLRLAKKSTAEC
jgi:hypothetical protein